MRDKNNELIVVTKSVFDKIKIFFKNIFNRNKSENISYNSSNESNKTNVDTEDVSQKSTNRLEMENTKEKQDFFKKYNDYKEGKVVSSSFLGSEKVKLNKMLNEELTLSKRNFEKAMKGYDERD